MLHNSASSFRLSDPIIPDVRTCSLRNEMVGAFLKCFVVEVPKPGETHSLFAVEHTTASPLKSELPLAEAAGWYASKSIAQSTAVEQEISTSRCTISTETFT